MPGCRVGAYSHEFGSSLDQHHANLVEPSEKASMGL